MHERGTGPAAVSIGSPGFSVRLRIEVAGSVHDERRGRANGADSVLAPVGTSNRGHDQPDLDAIPLRVDNPPSIWRVRIPAKGGRETTVFNEGEFGPIELWAIEQAIENVRRGLVWTRVATEHVR